MIVLGREGRGNRSLIGAVVPNPQPHSKATYTFSPDAKPDTTLRMSKAELEKLRAEIEFEATAPEGASKREFKRWPFDRRPIKMELQHPGGALTTLSYACRNLSRGGIALFHSAYVHLGSKCTITLPHPDRGELKVPGKVVRVRHVSGKVHELGIRFDQPIDVRSILKLDPSDGGFVLERVSPDSLRGELLYIEDNELDRRLIRHFLAETNMDVTFANTFEEGVERLSPDYHIIVCDKDLPDGNGLDILKKLREMGSEVPFILITADGASADRIAPGELRPDNFLIKPTTRERLFSVLGEVLLLEKSKSIGGGPLYTTLTASDPLFSEIPSFVGELKQMTNVLEKAVNSADADTVRRVCAQIRGSAPTLGFMRLADFASIAYRAVTSSMSVVEAEQELRALLLACKRVRAGSDAA